MKEQAMYGFPISSIVIRIIGLIIFSLILILLAVSISPSIGLLTSILLPLLLYISSFRFKRSFSKIREKILLEMIQNAALKGNERILDIGTGSGYIAIHFAEKVPNGTIIGIDKYDMKTNGMFQWFLEELKINFFGNTLYHAKQNAKIEHVEKKVDFVKANLLEPFPFEPGFFDVIVSSQFLYCIPHKELSTVLEEINRVVNIHGRLVFFESTRFMNWNIKKVKDFFEKKGYEVHITPLEYFSNKCIFTAKKL